MNTSEVLNKAADIIEKRGWGQGPDTWSGTGGLCIEGALAAVAGIKSAYDTKSPSRAAFDECPAYVAVADYLDMAVGIWEPGVWEWNDHPDRTATEVIEVLRAAAVIEAAREDQDAAWATYAEVVTA